MSDLLAIKRWVGGFIIHTLLFFLPVNKQLNTLNAVLVIRSHEFSFSELLFVPVLFGFCGSRKDLEKCCCSSQLMNINV